MEKYDIKILSKLDQIMEGDLDFHGQNNVSNLHKIHSFPAKFPPQLPAKFITELTSPGDVVLDPMMGSGTTIIESVLNSRKSLGFDIDPLAILLVKAKLSFVKIENLISSGYLVIERAQKRFQDKNLVDEYLTCFDSKTRDFNDYWFLENTKFELFSLIREIEQLENIQIKNILKVVFSNMIIAKSGGVSLALDLAHSRPHRAKIIKSDGIDGILPKEYIFSFPNSSKNIFEKKIRSAFSEFKLKLHQICKLLDSPSFSKLQKPDIKISNALSLPLNDNSVDLIITSPPYPSNAIDYMRAHKFTLVWLGYSIDELSDLRKEYFGGESISNVKLYSFNKKIENILSNIESVNRKKALVIRRYYSEMRDMLHEMQRVLRPGKAAIVVVGSSVIKGIDTEIQHCLKEIGTELEFTVSKIGVRQIERNRRMLPVSHKVDSTSIIQNRMHYEYILGFIKK